MGWHEAPAAPQPFVWRRLHSLMGFGLFLFLVEHLLTNSEAALIPGHDGEGFVRMVNFIHSLPYLPMIEIGLLLIPFAIHIVWGVQYLMTSQSNSSATDGSSPALGEYGRNRAYSWQRITSWILIIGVIAHVVQMRFIRYPTEVKIGAETSYMVPATVDAGIYSVGERLGVTLYDKSEVAEAATLLEQGHSGHSVLSLTNRSILEDARPRPFSADEKETQLLMQKLRQERNWQEALTSISLSNEEVVVVADNFGTAVLFTVRDTFKSPLMLVLYSLFVLFAVYHACNGLWTFMITWGITLTKRSQDLALKVSWGLMGLLSFLGLAAIWGTYWINLRF